MENLTMRNLDHRVINARRAQGRVKPAFVAGRAPAFTDAAGRAPRTHGRLPRTIR